MKKTYEKPMVMVENFELSQHIATGCKIIAKKDPAGKGFDVYPQDNPNLGGLIEMQNLFVSPGECEKDGTGIYCYHEGVNGFAKISTSM